MTAAPMAAPLAVRIDPLRPTRARLADARAALFGITAAQLADARAQLPDPNVEVRPRWSVRVPEERPPRRIAAFPATPAVDVCARELVFERVEFTDGRRRWATWELPTSSLDAASAWETLATREVIPFDWIENPRRMFEITREDPSRVTMGDTVLFVGDVVSLGVDDCPATAAACVALAADVPGVLRAEALVRAMTGCETVVWRVAARRRGIEALGLPVPIMGPGSMTVRSVPIAPTDESVAIQMSVALRLADNPPVVPTEPHHRAAWDLLATGYMLDAVTDGVATIFCPEL